ncbi:FtsK/SpoIIIE family DNA translocase [Tumebacillus flagellatus]|uniref:Cell division protein FtsK n=1 Tax=Tumebacillus flagellatus TaxID=1157490 RepID=A0A074LUD0_9BACL|nr:DNA translocase FtsK [Tumebacillus flagellatus]KEO84180.1 cell division protein FtsK [Tumebacillus flagellatus]
MARAKPKPKPKDQGASKIDQAKNFLKYEIIGLSLIAAAILGLAASGWVGRTIDYVFILLGGNFDWLLEWYMIYSALYLMIYRKRLKMNARQWGIALFLVVILTWSHLNLYDDLNKAHFKEPPNMWSVTLDRINKQAEFNTSVPVGQTGKVMPKPSAGGGLTGYVVFMSTHWLFDTAGTLFVLLVGGLISILLFTKRSLVVTLGNGKNKAAKRMAGTWEALREWPSLLREKKEARREEKAERAAEQARSDKSDPKAKAKAPGNVVSLFDTPPWDEHEDEHAVEAQTGAKEAVFASATPAEPQAGSDDLGFTVRSFADQLIREQEWETSEPAGAEGSPSIELPRFVQVPDSPQIKVQFPSEPFAKPKEAPASTPSMPSVKPVRGVPGEAQPEDVKIDFTPAVEDHYEIPPLSLLDLPKNGPARVGIKAVKSNALKLEQTFESFGVQVKVVNAQIGPTVTQYEVQPATGVKVSKIVNLADDIALALAAKDIRIEAPIPGKSAVGIEVPNSEVAVVTLREVLETPEFLQSDNKLSVVLGRDISGQPIVGNLAKMPHVLVAGATGSGKSVCVNGIITSILYKAKPSEVKFIMVDPKMVELNVYNGIPHLMAPVVTDPRRAAYALKKVVAEMEHRYELFSKTGMRNMDGYNAMMIEKGAQPLPYIVVIVDELADLMMVAPGDVEDAICRLAQMARAAGIHMIIATQRPSVDVITGVIKANIPSRIAFAVSSQVDSRTILDGSGAEKLLGRGDMLYLPVGASKPVRVQGAFLSDAEVERVVSYAKAQGEANYTVDLSGPSNDDEKGGGDEDLDDLFYDAVTLIVETQQASVSLLQRKLKVGYARAARLVDQMEDRGFVGPFEGSKPREVRVTRDQWAMMQQHGATSE